MKKSDIVVGKKYFIDYGYVGSREDINPDPYKVRTSSILCSLVRWIQVGYLRIYSTSTHPVMCWLSIYFFFMFVTFKESYPFHGSTYATDILKHILVI